MVPLITQGVMAEHGCKGTTFSYNQEFLFFCCHFCHFRVKVLEIRVLESGKKSGKVTKSYGF